MSGRLIIAFLAVVLAAPISNAQIRGTMARPGFVPHGGFAHAGRNGFVGHHARGIFPGSPFLYSDYDAGELYAADSAPPQVVMVQPPVDGSPRTPKSKPLLIEWQGDHYVRFGGVEESSQQPSPAQPDYAESTITSLPKERVAPTAAEPTPAVVVYRDGHREEVSDYAIADGFIYVRGTEWRNGYGIKHVPLSVVDPQATIQANRQRGVKFMWPSASNVVIASF
jgi:hypothetical protein